MFMTVLKIIYIWQALIGDMP